MILIATEAIVTHDGGMFFLSILEGLSGGLRFQDSPLYRYPHRSAEEAVRGDAKRIFNDIEACMERFHE